MQNILLNNGKLVPITSKEDALELIKEKLSSELAAYLQNIFSNMEFDEYEMGLLEEDNTRLDNENDDLRDKNIELEREVTKLKNELEQLKENKEEDDDDSLPFC